MLGYNMLSEIAWSGHTAKTKSDKDVTFLAKSPEIYLGPNIYTHCGYDKMADMKLACMETHRGLPGLKTHILIVDIIKWKTDNLYLGKLRKVV